MVGIPRSRSGCLGKKNALRILVVSDIHGNLEGLEACLAAAKTAADMTACSIWVTLSAMARIRMK